MTLDCEIVLFLLQSVFKIIPFLYRNLKGAEGNFVKVNLKTKSHVKGFALRGVALRKQVGVVHTCARSVPERLIARVSQKSEIPTFSYLTVNTNEYTVTNLCDLCVFSCTCRSSS